MICDVISSDELMESAFADELMGFGLAKDCGCLVAYLSLLATSDSKGINPYERADQASIPTDEDEFISKADRVGVGHNSGWLSKLMSAKIGEIGEIVTGSVLF